MRPDRTRNAGESGPTAQHTAAHVETSHECRAATAIENGQGGGDQVLWRLTVSRSGYSDPPGRRGTESRRAAAARGRSGQIRDVFEDSDQTPGSPRVCRQFQDDGSYGGEYRVASVMRDVGLRPSVPRRIWPRTTISDPELLTFDAGLGKECSAEAPDVK